MKRVILIILSTLFVPFVLLAQQRPQYTMYMINPFMVNPAVSGTEDYTDIRVGYRNQWTGFDGAPKTFFVSGHTNLGKNHVTNNRSRNKRNGFHGVGGTLMSDAIGPTVSNVITGAYSYHIQFSRGWFASLGASAGLQQYRLNAEKLTTSVDDDPLKGSFVNNSLADLNAGFWVYSNHIYIGGSVIQIFPQRIYNIANNSVSNGRLTKHVILMGGYRIPLGYDYTLIPSFVIRPVFPAPLTFDINAKLRYKDLAWIGVSYRRTDAVAVMIGMVFDNRFDINYSYDITTNPLRRYSAGSHEIVLGYRLKIKNRIICPSNYW